MKRISIITIVLSLFLSITYAPLASAVTVDYLETQESDRESADIYVEATVTDTKYTEIDGNNQSFYTARVKKVWRGQEYIGVGWIIKAISDCNAAADVRMPSNMLNCINDSPSVGTVLPIYMYVTSSSKSAGPEYYEYGQGVMYGDDIISVRPDKDAKVTCNTDIRSIILNNLFLFLLGIVAVVALLIFLIVKKHISKKKNKRI